MTPRTSYARVGEDHVAYQVVGEGPVDVLFAPEWATHLEAQWDEPRGAAFLHRLASFSRLLLFDKRGLGLSDPLGTDQKGLLDPWMDDVTAVLDAAGSERVALIGTGAGGPMTMLYAASHPERVSGLVLCNSAARFSRADDYPFGVDSSLVDDTVQWTRDTWGTGATFDVGAPSLAGVAGERDFHARFQRLAASPGVAAAMQRLFMKIDLRPVLPSIRTPTTVIHRAGDRLVEVGHGRYLAERIPGASFVGLPGDDHLFYAGNEESLLGEIQLALTGTAAAVDPDRVLATVLFTDIVGSTDRAVELGDRQWRMLLDRHDAAIRGQLNRFRGREIDTAGDGFFATFDGPARALRCACAIRDAIRALDLEVRIGVHTGEVEVRGDNYSGIAVHIGARVGALADGGEVLLTKTVADLVAGSGISFADRGVARLKGVPGEWPLVAVAAGA